MRRELSEMLGTFRDHWAVAPWWEKVFLAVAVVFAVIGVVVSSLCLFRRVAEPEHDDSAERVARDRGELLDEVLERNADRDEELATDAEHLADERADIEDRIVNAGEGRDAFHDELDRAAAAGDVGAILAARERRRRQGRSDG